MSPPDGTPAPADNLEPPRPLTAGDHLEILAAFCRDYDEAVRSGDVRPGTLDAIRDVASRLARSTMTSRELLASAREARVGTLARMLANLDQEEDVVHKLGRKVDTIEADIPDVDAAVHAYRVAAASLATTRARIAEVEARMPEDERAEARRRAWGST